ncbi:LOW QUALITY PROTEIN: uncharacterized protein O8D03_008421 [Erethizon dorsatum]
MKFKNQTVVSEFILVGLTDDPELQLLIFSLFLAMYLVTLLGNLLIILVISSDFHLHTPMYFFLSSLSFTDICISTTTIPKMLVNMQVQDHSITYTGCFTQITSAVTLGGVESCLLAVMAYDRYVAICQPLRYRLILTPYFCVLLVLLSLLISTGHALLHTLMALQLSFCTNVEIPHFFCELAQVIKLACSENYVNTLLIYSAGNIFFGVPIAGIIFSYTKIVLCILRMSSVRGSYKVFSTCGSHLSVVFLFYWMGFGVYLSSAATTSSTENAVASVMYIVIPQMMNPFIYSLRNKEMKTALRSRGPDRITAISPHPAMNDRRGHRLVRERGTQKAEQGPGGAKGAQDREQPPSLSENSTATGRETPPRETGLACVIDLQLQLLPTMNEQLDKYLESRKDSKKKSRSLKIILLRRHSGDIETSKHKRPLLQNRSSLLSPGLQTGLWPVRNQAAQHAGLGADADTGKWVKIGVKISGDVCTESIINQLFADCYRNSISEWQVTSKLHLVTEVTVANSIRFIRNMNDVNQTAVSEFFLLGLTDDPELLLLTFCLFLSMYLVTVLGNLLIIMAVSSDSHLHTPMYFFLSNLSFNDICLITCTIPKMLVNIRSQDKNITYTGCLSQVCVLIFGGLESCLLAMMAYDRYVAICHPLRYTVIMNPRLCVLLVLLSLFVSTVHALLHTLMALQLSFCTALEIPHFFCELAQIIKLACSDTLTNNILVYLVAGLFAGVPLSGIIFSYICIVSSVLRMSSGGKYKAFSTCGSHLAVVSLFYGTGFGVYISSVVTDSPRKTAVASVMYSVVTQMLNPFIYTLRNRDMMEALRRLNGILPSFLS